MHKLYGNQDAECPYWHSNYETVHELQTGTPEITPLAAAALASANDRRKRREKMPSPVRTAENRLRMQAEMKAKWTRIRAGQKRKWVSKHSNVGIDYQPKKQRKETQF